MLLLLYREEAEELETKLNTLRLSEIFLDIVYTCSVCTTVSVPSLYLTVAVSGVAQQQPSPGLQKQSASMTDLTLIQSDAVCTRKNPTERHLQEKQEGNTG